MMSAAPTRGGSAEGAGGLGAGVVEVEGLFAGAMVGVVAETACWTGSAAGNTGSALDRTRQEGRSGGAGSGGGAGVPVQGAGASRAENALARMVIRTVAHIPARRRRSLTSAQSRTPCWSWRSK